MVSGKMMRGRWRRQLLWALMAAAMLVNFAGAYGRVDTRRDSSLSVDYIHPNVTFRLYRVADVSETVRFTLCGDFARYSELQPVADEGNWPDLLSALEPRVIRDGIPAMASGRTDGEGKLRFAGLQPGLYLIRGDSYEVGTTTYFPSSLLVSVPNLTDGEVWEYDVTASPKHDSYTPPSQPSVTPSTTSVSVQKIWLDQGYEDKRPQAITVLLFRGDTVVSSVELSAANNWRHTWAGLPVGWRYQVVEGEVPQGYTDHYDPQSNTFVIVNEYTGEPETPDAPDAPDVPQEPSQPELPRTGQLWWPVPVLAAVGLALMLVGLIRKRGSAHEN